MVARSAQLIPAAVCDETPAGTSRQGTSLESNSRVDACRRDNATPATRVGALALQFVIWMGFYVAYQVVRGEADRDVARRSRTGVGHQTQQQPRALFEPRVQRFVDSSDDPRHGDVVHVLALAVRGRRRDAALGLLPPPRPLRGLPQLADRGEPRRPDRLRRSCRPHRRGCSRSGASSTRWPSIASVNHDSGLIAFASNPYAAMPSLHAMDALIVGIVMSASVRSTLARRCGSPGRPGSRSP